jgi:hypothetical protein
MPRYYSYVVLRTVLSILFEVVIDQLFCKSALRNLGNSAGLSSKVRIGKEINQEVNFVQINLRD